MAVESKSVKQSWLPYQLILDRFAISTNIIGKQNDSWCHWLDSGRFWSHPNWLICTCLHFVLELIHSVTKPR